MHMYIHIIVKSSVNLAVRIQQVFKCMKLLKLQTVGKNRNNILIFYTRKPTI